MKPISVSGDRPSTFFFGVPEAAVAAATAENLAGAPTRIHLLLAESLIVAEQWSEDVALFLRFSGDQRPTTILPFPEPVAEEPGEILDQTCDRLAVLAELAKQPTDGTDRILVATTPAALLAPCPERSSLEEREIILRPGETHDFTEIVTTLAERLGYASEILCERPGEFAPRGGLLDVYPLNAAAPVRIDFFGDEIEEIREFDPTTQRSEGLVDSVSIISADGTGERRGGFFEHLREGVTWILREPEKLTQRFPALFHQATELATPPPSLQDALERHTAKDDRFLGLAELETDRGPLASPDTREWTFETLENLRGEKSRDVLELDRFETERVLRISYLGQLGRWQREGYRVVISHGIEAERQRIEETIASEDDLNDLRPEYLGGGLHAGFRLKLARNETALGIKGDARNAGLVVATGREILGRDRSRRPGKTRRSLPQRASVDEALDFPELVDGDHLVHLQHGICLYRGLSELEIRDRMEEVITVEFDDGILLHLPLRESHLLSRYVGLSKVRPKLAKLGGKAWAKTRQSAERATLDLAADLLNLQAVRNLEEGFACDKDHDWQRDFEDAFPFTETPDQLTSIQAVKEDMESLRPMDRLLCGDVGFGKTEVALRAAFKAIMSGKQVAVLVPTTVLCQQHLNVFRERMAEFPVVVEMLSRFRSPAQQRRIAKAVTKGSVDLLIGTHRLLSRDIAFKDLGLLVIDEEQRFGVQQKEKLKRLREKVDVLTMSATPIPRTLYFALLGARTLSAIETAPTNRLPIRTFVRGYSDELLEEAIDREMHRNGQVFYLHNRVKTIEKIARGLRKKFPKLRIAVGHGQMDENELERVMTEFVAGKHDVLVCTTIIESGIDIPNCNTIIIEESDRFGLSQLYQLRGRVGRFSEQAYAYLLLRDKTTLLDNARKRLSSIRQITQLGAGFRIAMRDLELRGAGNLLGAEQSGHVAGVGFDLYCQLLRQSVARLKGDDIATRVKATVRLDFVYEGEGEVESDDATIRKKAATKGMIGAFLPRDYVTEPQLRIDFYRRIANAGDTSEINEIGDSLSDRFGKPPPPARALLACAEIRCLAETRGIVSVETEGNVARCRLVHPGKTGAYLRLGRRFPRITATNPTLKLKELRKILKLLPDD